MATKFATPLLDAALDRDEQKREDVRKLLIEKAFGVLAELNKMVPFKEAYLFGSIAKPYGFRDRSDIDVAFAGLEDAGFFKVMSFLSSELGRDVDVVQLEGHRLSDKIRRKGIRWTGNG
jgi:predicted nucleotidyltransferase